MGSPRILIVRTSSMGDVVQALPVLSALRRRLPSARLGWLVEEAYAPLLQHHPDLDELISVRLRAWRRHLFSIRTWQEIGAFFAALNRFEPEVVLDLMGNHKAGVLAAATLADRRIGLHRRFRREPSSAIWLSEFVEPSGPHSVDKMLAVLDALGIPMEPVRFDGDKLLTALQVPTEAAVADRAGVLIHPGAGWANKRYPPEKWGEVARLLRDALGIRIGVIESPGEEILAGHVVQASEGTAEALRAPELPQLADLLSRASLVLGGDSGPVHLAHALSRPVLCLMGPTDPESCGPHGSPEATIWRRLPCSFCHKRFSTIMPCLEEISPTAIAERAMQILAGRELPPFGPIDEGPSGCLALH